MPHRRTDKKGSFGGRFDELVKVVATEPHAAPGQAKGRLNAGDADISVHDRLLERASKVEGKSSY